MGDRMPHWMGPWWARPFLYLTYDIVTLISRRIAKSKHLDRWTRVR